MKKGTSRKATATVVLRTTATKASNGAGFDTNLKRAILEELWHQEHSKEIAEMHSLKELAEHASPFFQFSWKQRQEILPKFSEEIWERELSKREEQRAAKEAEKAKRQYEKATKTGWYSPEAIKARRSNQVEIALALGDFSSFETDPMYWEKSWREMESLLLDVAWELPSNYEASRELLLKGAKRLSTNFAKEMVFGCQKQLSRKLIANDDEAAKKAWTAAKNILRAYYVVWENSYGYRQVNALRAKASEAKTKEERMRFLESAEHYSECFKNTLENLLKSVGDFQRLCKKLQKLDLSTNKGQEIFCTMWESLNPSFYLEELFPQVETLKELYEALK